MGKRILIVSIFLFGFFCTPVLSEESFYSSDRDGTIDKVDLDGNVIWTTTVDPILIDQSNLESDTNGNLAYLHQKEGEVLKKFDKNTGDTIWQNEFPYKNPRILEVSDTGDFFTNSFSKTVKIDKSSGEMIWSRSPTSTAMAFGPEGYLFIGTAGDTLRKLNPSNGNILKKKQVDFTPYNMMINDYGYIYIGSENNDLYKYTSEFEKLWKVSNVVYKNSDLTIDNKGNIFTSNDDDVEQSQYDQFYKISPEGNILFQKDITKGGYFRSLDSFSGDTIITSSSIKYDGYIRTYDLNGNQILEHEMTKGKTEVVANDGSASFKPVQDTPPIKVKFDYSSKNPVAGDTTSFINLTGKFKNATISSYNWDFGDGDISNKKEPKHKFQDTGTYTVELTVETESGYTQSTSKNIDVQSGLYADFKIIGDTHLVAEPVEFQDRSGTEEISIDEWYWQFGDGDTSDKKNPNHVYKRVDSFDVILEVTGSDGFTDTVTKTLESIRNIDFSWLPKNPRPNISTEFTENVHDTGSETVFYKWTFGHGPVKRGESVTARFPETDSYLVDFVIENAVGRVFTDTKVITTESRKTNINRGRKFNVGR